MKILFIRKQSYLFKNVFSAVQILHSYEQIKITSSKFLKSLRWDEWDI